MGSLKKFLKAKKYLRIPLTLSATNHLELSVQINGVAGRFILDTGASNTCVGIDRVEYFKLASESSEVKAAGAGAMNMETMIAMNNKIRIGDWKKKKQQVVLFDMVHVNQALILHDALAVDGIIGADLLRKARAVIDYTAPCLYLKK